jgi:hypothetical protein
VIWVVGYFAMGRLGEKENRRKGEIESKKKEKL